MSKTINRLRELLDSGIITHGLYDDLIAVATEDANDSAAAIECLSDMYDDIRRHCDSVTLHLSDSINGELHYRNVALDSCCKMISASFGGHCHRMYECDKDNEIYCVRVLELVD